MKPNQYFGNASDELLKCHHCLAFAWALGKKSTAMREQRRQRIRSATKRVRVKPQTRGFGS